MVLMLTKRNEETETFIANSGLHPIFCLPRAKEQISAYWDRYHPLSDGLFVYDYDYAVIRSHMDRMFPEVNTITDIGCSFGVQSLFFRDKNYIGIDKESVIGSCPNTFEDIRIPFFREYAKKVQYYVAEFPYEVTDEMIGDIFISNMSIGYSPITHQELEFMKNVLTRFKAGYIRTTDEVLPYVTSHFENVEEIEVESHSSISRISKLYCVSQPK